MTPLVGLPPIVEDARRAVAALEGIGPEASDSMFDSIYRRARGKETTLVEETRKWVLTFGLPWPPEPPTLVEEPEEPEEGPPSEDEAEAETDDPTSPVSDVGGAAPIRAELEVAGEETTVQPKIRSTDNRPGMVAEKEAYALNKDYFRMPNGVADELLGEMPGPVLKAYVYSHRLAKNDGTFWVSAGGLANRIGCTTQRHGQRVIERLTTAGLWRLLNRGGPAGFKANTYQLVPPASLDLEAVRQALKQPLSPHRGSGPRDRSSNGP